MDKAELQNWFDKGVLPTVVRVLLFSYAIIIVTSSFAGVVDKFDDAIPLLDGVLAQQGRIPTLDFYSFYPPLGIYINAGLFELLGRSVLAVRLFGAVLFLLVLLLASRFFTKQFPYAQPVASVVVLLFAAAIGNALSEPSWPGFAVSVLALLTYLYSPYGKWNPVWTVGLAGVLTGLALLYRINFGGYVVIVVAFDLLVPWLPRGGAIRDRFRLKQDLLTATTFLVVLSLVFSVICFAIYGRHAVTTVVNLVVTAQRVMNLRSFIELTSSTEVLLTVALPAGWFFLRALLGAPKVSPKAFLPAIIAMVLLCITLAERAHLSVIPMVVTAEVCAVTFLHLCVYRLERSEFCLLLFYCGFVHYYLSRADWYHLRLLPIVVALLLPFLVLPSSSMGVKAKGTAIAVLLTATFVCLIAFETRPPAANIPKGFRLLADLVRHPHMSDSDRLLGPTPPGSEWLSVYDDEGELQALRYVRTRSRPDEAIFSGVPDHSRIYMNNLRFYFLAGRPIGVRVFQLEPVVATEEPVQQEIIHDLDQNKVKWVILDSGFWSPDKTFLAHHYLGSRLLDQYIMSQYHEEARFGEYRILYKTAVQAP